jgi:hypothetical protein
MQYTFRPLGPWTEANTEGRRSRGTFKATWLDTLRLLLREIAHLDAENVVIQADFREGDRRLDGKGVRADARLPLHPGVRVAFDSRHGPLTYATDSCEFWQHNVRSIALGLEALRAVDRYGVTKRGEQYTGWKQLGADTAAPMNGAMTRDEAVELVTLWVDVRPSIFRGTNDDGRRRILRAARAAAHPDRNHGDSAAFLQLENAGRALGLIT